MRVRRTGLLSRPAVRARTSQCAEGSLCAAAHASASTGCDGDAWRGAPLEHRAAPVCSGFVAQALEVGEQVYAGFDARDSPGTVGRAG